MLGEPGELLKARARTPAPERGSIKLHTKGGV